jgi:hypothetical protein
MLSLGDGGALGGTIQGFAGNDAIDLLGAAVTGLAYSGSTTSGVLTVSGSSGAIATLDFSGNYKTSSSPSLPTATAEAKSCTRSRPRFVVLRVLRGEFYRRGWTHGHGWRSDLVLRRPLPEAKGLEGRSLAAGARPRPSRRPPRIQSGDRGLLGVRARGGPGLSKIHRLARRCFGGCASPRTWAARRRPSDSPRSPWGNS